MELGLEIQQMVGLHLHVSWSLFKIFHLCLWDRFYMISSHLSFSRLFSLHLCLFSCLLCPSTFELKFFSSSFVNVFQICMINLDGPFLSSHSINTFFYFFKHSQRHILRVWLFPNLQSLWIWFPFLLFGATIAICSWRCSPCECFPISFFFFFPFASLKFPATLSEKFSEAYI